MFSQIIVRRLFTGLAIAAALGAAACSTTPPRTDAERQIDNETAARVTNALMADPSIYARHIDVRAYNGVVHLGGYVWTDGDLYRAQQVAALVPGVKEVVDDLELERGGVDNSAVSR
jgi:osmotically-inducible protein OsmY